VITTKGETFIKRFLAGQAGALVGAISVGIGDANPTSGDIRLQFEVARVPVDVTSYDFSTDQVVWKGSLDSDLVCGIYEVGIFTSEVNTAAGNQEAKLLTAFESAEGAWDSVTYDSSVTRLGADSLKQVATASTSLTNTISGLSLDFSQNSSLDTLTLAYYVGNAFTSSVKIRFRTDASNYYEFTITTPTSGYKFATFTLGTATVTGTPTWSNINDIQVITTATGGGTATTIFDGLRIDDTDTVAPDYGLVARYEPASPVAKVEGVVQDVEYALSVA
jgi:hypothetical protein